MSYTFLHLNYVDWMAHGLKSHRGNFYSCVLVIFFLRDAFQFCNHQLLLLILFCYSFVSLSTSTVGFGVKIWIFPSFATFELGFSPWPSVIFLFQNSLSFKDFSSFLMLNDKIIVIYGNMMMNRYIHLKNNMIVIIGFDILLMLPSYPQLLISFCCIILFWKPCCFFA